MMQARFSNYVEDDLNEIAEYIAADNPRRAVSFIREIRAEMDRIARAPELYRLRPEIGGDARLAVVGRYVIIFRMEGTAVHVERVVHGNRMLPALLQ